MKKLLQLYELAGRILNIVVEYLVTSPRDFMSGTMYSYASGVLNTFTVIGAALMSAFFVYGILRNYSGFQELRRPGAVLELFIRLILSAAVLYYCRELLVMIMDVTLGLARVLWQGSPYDSLMMVSDMPAEVSAVVGSLNIITDFGTVLIFAISSFVILASAVTVLLTVFGRFFRVYLHIAIAPIPLSTVSARETEQIGLSFIKSYIGCCLEVALIMLSIILYAVFFHNNVDSLKLISDSAENALVFNWILSNTLHVLILASIVKTCDNITGRWLKV